MQATSTSPAPQPASSAEPSGPHSCPVPPTAPTSAMPPTHPTLKRLSNNLISSIESHKSSPNISPCPPTPPKPKPISQLENSSPRSRLRVSIKSATLSPLYASTISSVRDTPLSRGIVTIATLTPQSFPSMEFLNVLHLSGVASAPQDKLSSKK